MGIIDDKLIDEVINSIVSIFKAHTFIQDTGIGDSVFFADDLKHDLIQMKLEQEILGFRIKSGLRIRFIPLFDPCFRPCVRLCRCVVVNVMIQSAITRITLLRACEMPLASLHPNKYTRHQILTNMTLHGPACSDL